MLVLVVLKLLPGFKARHVQSLGFCTCVVAGHFVKQFREGLGVVVQASSKPSYQEIVNWTNTRLGGRHVITIRPAMFLESFFQLAAKSIRDVDRIELPFGRGKTSPVAGADVAQVVATVLDNPIPHLGRIYELTGPQSQDMDGVTREFSDALNRDVTYSHINPEEWEQRLKHRLPEHLMGHLLTMGALHRAGCYNRQADGVQRLTGRPPMGVREFVSLHAEEFGGRRS